MYAALFHLSYCENLTHVSEYSLNIPFEWLQWFTVFSWLHFKIFHHSENLARNISVGVPMSSALSSQRLQMFSWFQINNILLISKNKVCECNPKKKKGWWGATSQIIYYQTIYTSGENWVKRIKNDFKVYFCRLVSKHVNVSEI